MIVSKGQEIPKQHFFKDKSKIRKNNEFFKDIEMTDKEINILRDHIKKIKSKRTLEPDNEVYNLLKSLHLKKFYQI